MRSNRQPLMRLVWVALLAISAAGSRALRHQPDDGSLPETPTWAGTEVCFRQNAEVGVAPSLDWADGLTPLGAARAAGAPCDVPERQLVPAGETLDDSPVASIHDAASAKPNRTPTVRRVCRVTAYNDRGLTAAGVPSGLGQCAAPEHIPIGSKIYIPALGRSYVVTDRTHRRFRQSTIDLFVPCEDRCRQFGRRFLEVEITPPEAKPSHQNLIRTAQKLSRTG